MLPVIPSPSSNGRHEATAPRASRWPRALPLPPGGIVYPILFRLPPYRQALPLQSVHAAGATDLGSGCVLGLRIFDARVDWPRLESSLRMLRLRYPTYPVVLELDPGLDDALYIATRAARMPLRAVLMRDEGSATMLRRHLTDPGNLPHDMVEWLTLRGYRLSPVLAELVRQIFARASAHHELAGLCREIGAVESSARFRFHKKSLPPPSRWLQVARALHAVLRLQAEPERPLLPLALELGYTDHSALSHQVYRSFRMRPGAVRGLLGWEWLMERWLESSRKGRRPASPG